MSEINESEWKAELDQLRGRQSCVKPFTEEQVKFLKYARENDTPVSWAKVEIYWKGMGWSAMKEETLRKRYVREIKSET